MSTVLVLGGARSGKSALAERLTLAAGAAPLYIATGQAWDDEMRQRIADHRQQRDGQGWTTCEAPLALADALAAAPDDQPVLIDCLTLWLTNLMLGEHPIDPATQTLRDTLAARPGLTVLVANEVGLGIVPDNALARRFRDAAGRLNQQIAAQADTVVFTAAGLPMILKGHLPPA
ncbi:bifunctional adenosylcobinamide kinase/adenosylcobinamide-phosphate guanylyltransferase [Pararhodobacter zhoushanensis]|uniref:bifunctional adenosylcobinamide kinase/adenosylcobinamide-phosphate guanylyltransferase n=1 Tax=Pararhodobacter zhoushanensis TaxID=2479545 RepID=UPI000F8C80DF|nr:bifunctional adenosylcobinamide kinase/adenosylcobinamide-phosphate guanylyltransferase [Pararhodobacter zhoushanensis]